MRPGAPHRALAAVAVLLCSLLSGCGGSSGGNGVASKSPAQIVAAARAAAARASSVHVAGSIVSGGSPITLDMHLLAGHGGRGRLTASGLGFELIQLGPTVYVKGSPELYSHVGGPAAAQLLQGRWLKAPTDSGEFSAIASLTDLNKLLGSDVPDPRALSKGHARTVAGTPAIPVTDAAKGETVYVATTGSPYPVELAKTGKGGGRVVFDRWNQPVVLVAPANAIDITRLRGGH